MAAPYPATAITAAQAEQLMQPVYFVMAVIVSVALIYAAYVIIVRPFLRR